MTRFGMLSASLLVLITSGCSWVDSTGRQTNTAPKIALESQVIDEKAAVEIDLSEADKDGNLSGVDFEILESGASLAASCAALFPDMEAYSPSDFAPDITGACADGVADCSFEFAESSTEVGVYVATVPELQKPTAYKFELSLVDTDAESAEEEFTLCLRSVSEPPVAVDDAFSVEYLDEREVQGAVFNDECSFLVRDGVMLNDSDDFDVLEAGLAENGCLDVNLVTPPQFHDGVFSLSREGGFNYKPVAGLVAGSSDSFSYRLSDGVNVSDAATVTLNIVEQGSNTPPEVLNPELEMDEDTVLQLDVDELATDVDGHAIQMHSVGLTQPPENGTVYFEAGFVRYTPDQHYFGADSFSYVVRDVAGAITAGSVSVTVLSVNDRPTVEAQGSTTLNFAAPGDSESVYFTVSDMESPLASLLLDTVSDDPGIATATVLVNTDPDLPGNVQLDVLAQSAGDTTVTLTASDGLLTGSESVDVFVAAENTPPVATAGNGSVELGSVLIFDVVDEAIVSDADSDTLTLQSVAMAAGSLDTTGQVSIRQGTRIRYVPGVAGTHVIDYTVTDGEDTDSSTLTVVVTEPNTPPVATDDGTADAIVGTELRYDVVANGSASDADVGDTLTVISVGFAAGSVDDDGTLSADEGEIVYTPGIDGDVVVEFEVSDGVDTASGSVAISVTQPD